MDFEFDAELWLWEARQVDSRTFVTLPEEASEVIHEVVGPPQRAFGAVRVRVSLGATTWRTSIFPNSGSGRYVLPVKKAVCKAAGVAAGDTVRVRLEVLV